MKLNRKDRKIKTQQNLINRLEEENRILKEQMEAYSCESMKNRLVLAEQAYQEYTDLIEEVNEMKQEYVGLIKEMTTLKEEMKRKCK